MSFDVDLVPLWPDDDFAAAMDTLTWLDAGGRFHPPPLDPQSVAAVVMRIDPRYRPVAVDAEAIADRLGTMSPGEVRRRFADVHLGGRADDGSPLAQLHFYQSHVVIHCYSGTSADELDQMVIAICRQTGLAAIDPQTEVVWRMQPDGTLG